MRDIWQLSRTKFAVAALVMVGAVAGLLTFPAATTSDAQAVTTVVAVREVMGSGLPENADGQALQLLRTIVPPGVVLPQHTHPGMQVAWIDSGVLTYTVVSGGEMTVTREGMEGSPQPAELLGPGDRTELHPGDAIVETEGVVHYGENLGTEEVVIWSAVLFDPGQPAAVPYAPAATPER